MPNLHPSHTNLLRKITSVRVSPWSEMILSLHVLQRPEHHPYRLAWAKALAARMSPEHQQTLAELSRYSDQWFGLLNVEPVDEPALRSAQAGIDALGRLPDAEFVYALLDRAHLLSDIALALRAARSPRAPGAVSGASPLIGHDDARRALIEKPAAVRSEMLRFLQQYHDDVFAAEWERVSPWLVRAAKILEEQLEKQPVASLQSLHPRLRLQANAIEAHKATLYTFPYEQLRRIVVNASTFIHPHLLIDFYDGILTVPLAVEVPHLERSDEVPADLVRVFKALGDPTRLRIMRFLHAAPHCTQQLAQALGISEAAVSKQLKLLAQAGFIASERRGSFIFYSLRSDETEMTLVYLRQFLEQ